MRKTKQLTLRINQEHMDKLDQLAIDLKISKQALLTLLLERMLRDTDRIKKMFIGE